MVEFRTIVHLEREILCFLYVTERFFAFHSFEQGFEGLTDSLYCLWEMYAKNLKLNFCEYYYLNADLLI